MKSSLRLTATSVIDFLQRHDGAAGLLPAAQRILKLRRDFLALIPAGLREACDVSGFDDGIAVVRVSSAGTAVKLRQTLPRLRDGLIERGWQVSSIRVRVQPRGARTGSSSRMAPSKTAIPREGVEAFADLGRTLEDSPLKSAVERLVRRRT